MDETVPRGESPCVDALALRFIEARGQCEIEFAVSALQNPGLAIGIAKAFGVTEASFYVHYDARLMFCACSVGFEHGLDVVYRLAQKALELECAPYVSPRLLDCLLEQYHFSNEFLLSIHLTRCAKRLGRMDVAQRDAQEHLDYAKQLLARGAA